MTGEGWRFLLPSSSTSHLDDLCVTSHKYTCSLTKGLRDDSIWADLVCQGSLRKSLRGLSQVHEKRAEGVGCAVSYSVFFLRPKVRRRDNNVTPSIIDARPSRVRSENDRAQFLAMAARKNPRVFTSNVKHNVREM
ncbi:hypothetical protein PUN28_004226 [Cardiocondyla obscurior]|uniref:Uncharacterized protein n=1 Tax=Cardiocondyla obscurior TaxID=286306 RepID=A0AAW2GQ45_9HYME